MNRTSPCLPRRDRPAGPRSLNRVLDILAMLADGGKEQSLGELTGTLGIPKSSLLNLLRGLCNSRHLVREGQKYRIGPEAVRLAGAIESCFASRALPADIRCQAQPEIQSGAELEAQAV
ncbi:MAG TPA: helix-turn-helix domain-containing protein [Burkholderiales bacterium]|nr:helix-turn-helix domain-containing protein [Burkholderiales bacterium]